jgi:hypothetical protein
VDPENPATGFNQFRGPKKAEPAIECRASGHFGLNGSEQGASLLDHFHYIWILTQGCLNANTQIDNCNGKMVAVALAANESTRGRACMVEDILGDFRENEFDSILSPLIEINLGSDHLDYSASEFTAFRDIGHRRGQVLLFDIWEEKRKMNPEVERRGLEEKA